MAIWNERIKQKRTDKGITLSQVADRLNVTEATAQRYESGSIKSVPYEHMCTYAQIFNCTPQYLMGWSDDDGESIIEYLDRTIEEIISSLENAGYVVIITESTKGDTVIIKNKSGKIIKTATEHELLALYEKQRISNIDQIVTSMISNEMKKVIDRTDLYIQLFESYGYEITVNISTVSITDSQKQEYTIERKMFMGMIQRCHKDLTWNIEKLLSEHYATINETPEHLILNAAHERTDIDITDEMRESDDDIMNDPNF